MKKNDKIKKRKIRIIILIILSISIQCYLSGFNFIFILFLILISNLYFKLYKIKQENSENKTYRQLELLVPLMIDLEISKDLPNTAGYAATPDFLCLIRDLIKKHKPKLILEAGSGVSTLIASYSLKKYVKDNPKIISLDHEEYYTNKTIKAISKHSLNEYSEVYHAPLKKYDKNLEWYDDIDIKSISEIDLLIIDGPPTKSSVNARYPALPIIMDKLKNGAIIILDDGKRKDEQKTVELWKNDFNNLEIKYINTAKGTYIIKKNNY